MGTGPLSWYGFDMSRKKKSGNPKKNASSGRTTAKGTKPKVKAKMLFGSDRPRLVAGKHKNPGPFTRDEVEVVLNDNFPQLQR